MLHSKTLLLVLAGLVLASPRPAGAYVRTKMESGTPLVWKNPCVGMVVHNASPPDPLTPSLVLKAMVGAGAVWSRPAFSCTPLQVQSVATSASHGPAVNDGVNRVVFRRDRWCRDEADPASKCYDASIVAVTTVTATMDGTIIDADIEINAKNFAWADLSVTGSKGQDLQSMLTHELGHLLGFDHTCYSGGAKRGVDNLGKPVPDCAAVTNVQRTAIMFPTTVGTNPIRRSLSGDEGKAICAVYPVKGSIPTCALPNPNAAPARDAGGSDAQHMGDAGADTARAGNGGDDEGGCSYSGGRSSGQGALLSTLLGLVTLARWRRRRR